ncbi:MAG: site-specific DNA-methyltransferase [Elusimicrobia bacterium]|nr:site-specific DNA-methyltransferase [Elusimicrobiota bacterium]
MEKMSIEALKPYARNPRKHSAKQIEEICQSIKHFGFTAPIIIDEKNMVLAGHGRLLAAQKLALKEVPIVRLKNLSETQKKAYVVADNKIGEHSSWDPEILALEVEDIVLSDPNFDVTLTGLATAEVDLLLNKEQPKNEEIDAWPGKDIPKRVELGDLWQLGSHKLFCGNALHAGSYGTLLGQEKANIIVTDPPYDVKVKGHICGRGKTKHTEFIMASGELSSEEFTAFLRTAFEHMANFSTDGSLHYIFQDWRHIEEITNASKKIFTEFKNVLIWNKLSGGMGSLYRSQHEFIFVYKNGTAPHTNNINLGAQGRYRTNVIDYPGIFINNKLNKENIKLHPTVKPVGLLADLILDASKIGDIVLDPFGGSGSTLLAAERTGRKARLIELSEHYCDVAIYRWEKMAGKKAKKVEEDTLEL